MGGRKHTYGDASIFTLCPPLSFPILLPVTPAPPPSHFLSWATTPRATILFIFFLALIRLLYLFFYCPYNLIEDEAHYWEWSRHLDWSYYSKGPGVAWTIFASTKLLGTSEFAVRITAPLFSAITAYAIARLTKEISSDWRAGFIAAVLFTCAPALQITGLLFLIDGPYCAFWSLAALASYCALFRQSASAWLALGAAIAAGFIFKYTILLFLPGFILFAIFNRKTISLHPQSKLLIPVSLILASLGLAPILIWNSQHDWVTIRHLLGHLGIQGGDTPVSQGSGTGYHYNPLWTLDYIIAQFAFLGGTCAAVIAALFAIRRSRTPQSTFLVFLAAPIFIFYFLVSFITEPEGNWAIGGLITLFPLAALWLLPRLDAFTLSPTTPSPANGFYKTAIVIGIISGMLMLRLDSIDLILTKIGVPEKIQRIIPMGRLTGAPEQALNVARIIDVLKKKTDKEPFIITQHYGRASQIAFYLPNQPRNLVYCASAYTGGRTTQYDLWPQASLKDPTLLGRPAILLGGDQSGSEWAKAFGSVTPLGTLDGDRKKNRPAFSGLDYRGW